VFDEDAISELELGTTEELLSVMLEDEVAAELKTTEELLEATDELLGVVLELLRTSALDEESSTELELGTTEKLLLDITEELLDGGGGGSMFVVQEKSSEAKSIAANERKRLVFIVNSCC
jgi:hypothetical protein